LFFRAPAKKNPGNLLLRFFHFLLSTAIWVALGAALMGYQAYQVAGLPPNVAGLLFLAAATICSYNFHFLLGPLRQIKMPFLHYFKQQWPRCLLILLAALAALLLLPHTGFKPVAVGTTIGLTLLYSTALLPAVPLTLLKKLGFLKTVLLAFTWVWATTWLPLGSWLLQHWAGINFALYRGCLLLMLCLLFDNRDAYTDLRMGLHSMATKLSAAAVARLQLLCIGLMLVAGIATGFLLRQPALFLSFLLTTAFVAGLCIWPLHRRSFYYYYGWVDGALLFCPIAAIAIGWLWPG
jgi:hypothetical protein